MTTIKFLTDLEEILLRADAECRYQYTLDELIKSEQYLKEIGYITNLFFNIQFEYSKTLNTYDEEKNDKLTKYHNFLVDGTIDVDIKKYLKFVMSIKEKIKNEDTLSLIEKLQPSE